MESFRLEPGSVLGHYRLESKIGQGGMGVVWRAVDTTLGRAVALKFLPEAMTRDAEHVARFDREARVLAALHHPGIASIFGFESAGDTRFLVMELAEGTTLAERLLRGPLPVPEAIDVGRQVATALEAAHERGIVHRDLKPQNVQVDAGGGVKLLDFGLARAWAVEPGPEASPADSPTISALLTSPAVILGTAAYMSPEQARGRPVDRRADIWAFGVLLFEALTGGRLFAGETVSDTIAAVLRREVPWNELPAATPPSVRTLLERCLERDARQRLRDIGEARIVLERAEREPKLGAAPAIGPTPRRDRRVLAGLALALAVGAAVTWAALSLGRPPAAPLPVRRFELPRPGAQPMLSPVVSPDGTMAAYLSGGRIWLQPLDQFEPRDLAAAGAVTRLFWSPDSKWIGTLAGAEIGKLPVSGGAAQVLSRTATPFPSSGGAGWNAKGSIVASHATEDGIFEVSDGGGNPRTLVLPDTTRETDFHEPSVIPGGRGILAVVHRKEGRDEIILLRGTQRTVLLRQPGITLSGPVWSPSGHVVYTHESAPPEIWALPFSAERGRATGEPFQVAAGASDVSVSADGSLLYLERRTTGLQFTWVDRDGSVLDTLGSLTAGHQGQFALSPDGSRVLAALRGDDGGHLWLFDSRRGTRSRFTPEATSATAPAWSADGAYVTYQMAERIPPPTADLWWALGRRADGGGNVDTLGRGAIAPVLTPDGRHVIYSAGISGSQQRQLRIAPRDGDFTGRPLGRQVGASYFSRPS
ncbi:MAG: protein kinase, partial [Candidatus Eisenbacteria bacterium]